MSHSVVQENHNGNSEIFNNIACAQKNTTLKKAKSNNLKYLKKSLMIIQNLLFKTVHLLIIFTLFFKAKSI